MRRNHLPLLSCPAKAGHPVFRDAHEESKRRRLLGHPLSRVMMFSADEARCVHFGAPERLFDEPHELVTWAQSCAGGGAPGRGEARTDRAKDSAKAKIKAASSAPSYAGLTRVSFTLRRSLSKKMDGRVKPGHNESLVIPEGGLEGVPRPIQVAAFRIAG
jgi:hypothetical protein